MASEVPPPQPGAKERAEKKRRTCQYEGCFSTSNDGKWCPNHRGGTPQICAVVGCTEFRRTTTPPYCWKHRNHVYDETHETNMMVPEYELVRRLKRDRQLREKMLVTVAFKQDNKCAGTVKTCYTIIDGKATWFCPWGGRDGRQVPDVAQQLDHIERVADGGGDEQENLQMLCACCHAAKTFWETRKLLPVGCVRGRPPKSYAGGSSGRSDPPPAPKRQKRSTSEKSNKKRASTLGRNMKMIKMHALEMKDSLPRQYEKVAEFITDNLDTLLSAASVRDPAGVALLQQLKEMVSSKDLPFPKEVIASMAQSVSNAT